MTKQTRIAGVRFSELTPMHQYRLLSSGVTADEYNRRGSLSNSWRDQAACIGQDPAQFIPDVGDLSGQGHTSTAKVRSRLDRMTKAARIYCDVCPVKSECLAYGIASKSVGVFGGVMIRNQRHAKSL